MLEYLDRIVHRNLLVLFNLCFLTLIFVDFLGGLGESVTLGESGILKPSTITVLGSVCAITASVICLCLMKLGMPVFHVYHFL